MDYAGNSKKEKEEAAKEESPAKEKEIKKVVTGEVIAKKKSIGRKAKDLIIEADFRTVFSVVIRDLVIPNAKKLLLDSISRGTEWTLFPDSRRRGGGVTLGSGVSKVSYSSISRAMGGSPLRNAPALERGPRSTRQARDDVVISSRKEAEEVLEVMTDIIDNYDVVSVADLNEMVGWPSSHVDHTWGWTFLGDVQIRQIREGYLIDLPPAEPIQ